MEEVNPRLAWNLDGRWGRRGGRCLAIRRLPPLLVWQEPQHLRILLLLHSLFFSRDTNHLCHPRKIMIGRCWPDKRDLTTSSLPRKAVSLIDFDSNVPSTPTPTLLPLVHRQQPPTTTHHLSVLHSSLLVLLFQLSCSPDLSNSDSSSNHLLSLV